MEVKLQKDTQCRQFNGQTDQLTLPGTYKEFCFGTQVIADFAQTQTIPGIFVGDIGRRFEKNFVFQNKIFLRSIKYFRIL